MMDGGARDPRFGAPYGMGLLDTQDMYGAGRAGTTIGSLRPPSQQCPPRGLKRPSDQCYDERPSQSMGLDHCPMPDITDDGYSSLQPKKSPPSNGKKTKGRVKIKMEYIDNKLRRYTTFSKRKTGIMKKAYELSTLTGTQVMLLVASETGHVYTFATRKLQPMITSDSGKRLIQTCLNSPDPPNAPTGDQRMSATGFEETELTYNIVDDDVKSSEGGSTNVKDEPATSGESDESGSEDEGPHEKMFNKAFMSQPSPTPEDMDGSRRPTSSHPSSSTTCQEADSSKPSLARLGPKLNLPGGASIYPTLASMGLEGMASNLGNLGLPNLAMGYPHGIIVGLPKQEGGPSTSQPQFITIPLSMAMSQAPMHSMSQAPLHTLAETSSSSDHDDLQDLTMGPRK